MTLSTIDVEMAIAAHDDAAGSVGATFIKKLRYATIPLSIGDTTEVDAKWAKKGGGEDIWAVFKIGDQLFRAEGYHSPFTGGEEWEKTITEVKQIPKTIFVYEPVV